MKLPAIPIFQGGMDPAVLLISLIQYALLFVGAIAFIFIIWGGIKFITSGGDSGKTTDARNTILYAIIGIIVIVLSYAIVTWAANFALKLPK